MVGSFIWGDYLLIRLPILLLLLLWALSRPALLQRMMRVNADVQTWIGHSVDVSLPTRFSERHVGVAVEGVLVLAQDIALLL